VPVAGAGITISAACVGSTTAALCLASAIVLRLLRHNLRLSIAREALPPEFASASAASLALGYVGWPFVHIVHTAAFLAYWATNSPGPASGIGFSAQET
jgi:hypothetical protein